MLFRVFFALPFQIRQCSRSTSVTITSFAVICAESPADSALAICLRCCSLILLVAGYSAVRIRPQDLEPVAFGPGGLSRSTVSFSGRGGDGET
jgi:hypothetical protein